MEALTELYEEKEVPLHGDNICGASVAQRDKLFEKIFGVTPEVDRGQS